MATILEALQNADINLIYNGNSEFGRLAGRNQLHNAVVLLEKNYSIDDDIEELLQEHGSLDSVPEKAVTE